MSWHPSLRVVSLELETVRRSDSPSSQGVQGATGIGSAVMSLRSAMPPRLARRAAKLGYAPCVGRMGLARAGWKRNAGSGPPWNGLAVLYYLFLVLQGARCSDERLRRNLRAALIIHFPVLRRGFCAWRFSRVPDIHLGDLLPK